MLVNLSWNFLNNKLIRFIHLLPLDCMGGVECAAKTAENISKGNIFFSLFYISKKSRNYKSKILDFLDFLRDSFFSVFKILNYSPDVLIISLWKSCIVGIFIKILKPEVKIILFLHSSNLNFIDYFFNNLIGIIAFEIWADSEITLTNRLNLYMYKGCLLWWPKTKIKIYQHLDIKTKLTIYLKARYVVKTT